MRDIRDDLRQRIQLLKQERDDLQRQLQAKLAELDEYEGQLSGLLALEEKRAARTTDSVPTVPDVEFIAPRVPAEGESEEEAVESGSDEEFAAAVLETLKESKPLEHGEIKKRLEDNWTMEKGSLGRAIQGQLLSLKQRGAVEYLGDRRWRRI
jgi:uncharacterized protein involved in exopolysaccharide biosynthesis